MSSALATALSVILPRPQQTLLLRASLLTGAESRAAWEEWKRIAGDPKTAMAQDRWSVKRLLPPLYAALRESGADVDPALEPYLKLAYVREQMRSRTYMRICGEILTALDDAHVTPIVLRGAALAATAYPDPALRHCHDIALLVRDADVSRAADAIRATGRTNVLWDPSDGGPAAILRDETTLPIELHTRLLDLSYYRLEWEDVWPRTRLAKIGGRTARVLSPEEALIHVCVHASYSRSRDSLRWVGDAWHLMRVNELDWSTLVRIAADAGVAVPLFVTLRYLADALGARVDRDALAQLESIADSASPIARDVALHGARVGECEELGVLFERMAGGLRIRALTAAWLLFPSREYVRDVIGVTGVRRVTVHYARRPVDYARRFLFRGDVLSGGDR